MFSFAYMQKYIKKRVLFLLNNAINKNALNSMLQRWINLIVFMLPTTLPSLFPGPMLYLLLVFFALLTEIHSQQVSWSLAFWKFFWTYRIDLQNLRFKIRFKIQFFDTACFQATPDKDAAKSDHEGTASGIYLILLVNLITVFLPECKSNLRFKLSWIFLKWEKGSHKAWI